MPDIVDPSGSTTAAARGMEVRCLALFGGAAAFALTALLSACEPEAQGACDMQEITDLPVLDASGVPAVPASINGHDVAFAVDTGTPISAIDPTLAQSDGLAQRGTEHVALSGVGGAVWAPLVSVRDLVFGAAAAHDVVLAEAIRTRGSIAGRPFAGIWGTDFLAGYDVEFDLPDRRMGLYVERGRCGSDFTPWDVPSDVIPIIVSRGRRTLRTTQHVYMTIRLDGRSVHAFLDSGATLTSITPATAIAAGVDPTTMGSDRIFQAAGLGRRAAMFRIHRFDSLEVGNEREAPVDIAVGPTPENLVGADWLRLHRVWISFPNDVMLIARDPARPTPLTPAGTRP